MGWLLAFLFFLLAGLFGFLLYGVVCERASLLRRVAGLEPVAAAKEAADAERQKMAVIYSEMRKRFQGVLDADAEKAKVVAKAKELSERFNEQFAAAKAQYASVVQKCKEEEAAHEARMERRTREIEAEYASFVRKCKVEQEINEGRLARRAQEAAAEAESLKKKCLEEVNAIEEEIGPLRAEHKALSAEAMLVAVAFHKNRFGFATSERYKQALAENYEKQRVLLTNKRATYCAGDRTLEGMPAHEKKSIEKMLMLMLRAFNGECDSAIANVKATNSEAMENKINKSFDAINKLGGVRECYIEESYKSLRIEELRLVHEHAAKVHAEREEQKAIKEEMRQQALAEKEAERAQQEAERERRQYQAALEKARADMDRIDAEKEADSEVQEEKHRAMEARIAELEQMVAETDAKQERAMSLAQQTRSGHVYVISNVGSFGVHVYKIGMTRRLDPMDRIWELSDASVPFDFDVHAIIYTDDAPGLEGELHKRFADRRINVVNERKEFFHVTIEEIADVVRDRCGDIELTLAAEAAEFLQSEAYRRENGIHGSRHFDLALNPEMSS
jgi:hypothetical protein